MANEASGKMILIVAADADDFLTKPFSPTELQARVEPLIEKELPKLKRFPTCSATGLPTAH